MTNTGKTKARNHIKLNQILKEAHIGFYHEAEGSRGLPLTPWVPSERRMKGRKEKDT